MPTRTPPSPSPRWTKNIRGTERNVVSRPRSADSLEHAVREIVASIPAGRVASYGEIGNRIGVGARQVGRAMSLLDDSVPWWRVVHADGTPATCHGGQAAQLLIAEGTPMLVTRVDMNRARQRWDR